MEIVHSIGRSLQLRSSADSPPLWCYDYGGRPKPYFHPLSTPAGFCVSLFEPSDHVWHRGLWFAIKFVNGDNFWEENPPFGAQVAAAPPALVHSGDGGFAWDQQLRWERPGGAGPAIVEQRRISYRPIDSGSYALDWDIRLDPQSDLELDRTPFTTWGGYGGLTLRGNRNWLRTRLMFSDGSTSERPTGVRAQWADLSGIFDGGANKEGGIALLDNPSNLRHPQPWYGATGAGHYINAAFLFHEPLSLAAHEPLRLRYRCLIHDGVWSRERIQACYDLYAEETQSG